MRDEFDVTANHYFQGLLDDAGVPHDDVCAIKMIKILFEKSVDEIDSFQSYATISKIAANNVLDRVKIRYGLVLKYENSFFPINHTHYDRTPFLAALLLDALIDDYEDDVTAKVIWEQAVEFEANGYPKKDYFLTEAIFLAHMNMMERLLIAEQNFDELDADDIKRLLSDEIPNARERAQKWTDLGKALVLQADVVEERLRARLKELSPRPRPVLVVDNTGPLPPQ